MEPQQTSPNIDTDGPESLVAEGTRWLELLGEEALVGTLIPYYKDGRQLRAEEFTLIYDLERYNERVRPLFMTLGKMPADNPKRAEYQSALRKVLHSYLDKPAEG